ncbi:carbohydrate kinase family protein [bacterium]|nr:MAG: carbohydrate kinase family protein [bacterium]
MKKIITIGGAVRDIFCVTDMAKMIANDGDVSCEKMLAFELGSKIYINKFLNTMGGSACNVSTGLKKMGINSFPYVEVGDDDAGEIIKGELKRNKVPTKLVHIDRKKQTGFSFFIVDSESREHVVFIGKAASEDININIKEISAMKPDWLYVGSLGKCPEDEFLKIRSVKKNIDVKIAMNPGIDQIERKNKELLKVIKLSDVLILNRDEAVSMVVYGPNGINKNIPEYGLSQIRFLFDESKKWGVDIIIIADGEGGAYLKNWQENKMYFCESYPAKKLVDTTGAGDAFVSGFMAGFMVGETVERCLKLGVVNGSSVIQFLGAQEGLLTVQEAEKKIKKIKVRMI